MGSSYRWTGATTRGLVKGTQRVSDEHGGRRHTGATMALMAEDETAEAAMRLLWRWIERYGIPRALYTDKKKGGGSS